MPPACQARTWLRPPPAADSIRNQMTLPAQIPSPLLIPDSLLALAAPEPGGNPLLGSWVPIVAMVLIFWLVVIAPERKQRRLREEMLGALKKGDEVLTNGGMLGKVTQVRDAQEVTLEVADGVRIRFLRSAISSLREPSSGGSSDS